MSKTDELSKMLRELADNIGSSEVTPIELDIVHGHDDVVRDHRWTKVADGNVTISLTYYDPLMDDRSGPYILIDGLDSGMYSGQSIKQMLKNFEV